MIARNTTSAMNIFSRFRRQLGAYGFSFCVTTVGRIVLISAIVRNWSEPLTAYWLAVTSFAYSLALSDFGITRYFGNEALAAAAAGERKLAATFFGTAHLFALAVCLAACGGVGLLGIFIDLRALVGIENSNLLTRWEAHLIAIAATLNATLTIVSSCYGIPFRVRSHEARVVFYENLVRLIESVGIVIVAMLALPLWMAMASLVIPRLGYIAIIIRHELVREMFAHRTPISVAIGHVRKHGVSSLAHMASPLADALLLNSTPALVGIALGPSAVSVFSAARVYTRLVWQVPQIIKMSIVNELSRCGGKGQYVEMWQLSRRATVISVSIMIVVAVVGVLGADRFFYTWTDGAVGVEGVVLLVLFVSAAASGATLTLLSPLEALNINERHSVERALVALLGVLGFAVAASALNSLAWGVAVLSITDVVMCARALVLRRRGFDRVGVARDRKADDFIVHAVSSTMTQGRR